MAAMVRGRSRWQSAVDQTEENENGGADRPSSGVQDASSRVTKIAGLLSGVQYVHEHRTHTRVLPDGLSDVGDPASGTIGLANGQQVESSSVKAIAAVISHSPPSLVIPGPQRGT